MRWLLAKDLRILGRSPLLAGALIVYPVVLAVLIGLALSRGPDRPKVAIANEIPKGQALQIGSERFDLFGARQELFKHVDPIEVATRDQAIEKVRSGQALGAIVIPGDTVQKLQSQFRRPHVEVYVNQEDPLKARLVDDTITSVLSQANQRIGRAFTRVNLGYLGLLLRGGPVTVFGQRFQVLGLRNVERIARAAAAALPSRTPLRPALDRVVRFTVLAQQNLDLTDNILAAVREPIVADKKIVRGSSVPLTTFAAAIAVAVSLAFVTVMLAAGSLALERSENAFGRLVRGPVTPSRLLAEKIVLAVICSVIVTFVMLLGLSIFVPLQWDRIALWILALACASLAFAALGVAIGGIAREVAAASLLAFALLVPVAFLALVPSGLVSQGLYDASRLISAAFPFRPTIDAMTSALYGSGQLAAPLLHLAALAAGFAALGRLALRRFA
jgi:ABC-type multidrug transport system permease subunit